MSQDTVADLLSSLRNAYEAGRQEIRAPFSGFGQELVNILVKEGYLAKFQKVEVRKGVAKLLISLNKSSGGREKVISRIERLSRPGVRRYIPAGKLAYHNRRLGIAIISTPKGLMTTREAAKKSLGGELICRVW
jgi:small subunit ribosomal protein S8